MAKKFKLFVPAPHHGAETADRIRENINSHMVRDTGISLGDYEKDFKIVIDSSTTMLKVFGASIFSSLVSYSHPWTASISHISNSSMKSALENKDITNSDISKSLTLVKSITSTLKHASLNDDLEDGFHLLQEVMTGFGST